MVADGILENTPSRGDLTIILMAIAAPLVSCVSLTAVFMPCGSSMAFWPLSTQALSAADAEHSCHEGCIPSCLAGRHPNTFQICMVLPISTNLQSGLRQTHLALGSDDGNGTVVQLHITGFGSKYCLSTVTSCTKDLSLGDSDDMRLHNSLAANHEKQDGLLYVVGLKEHLCLLYILCDSLFIRLKL